MNTFIKAAAFGLLAMAAGFGGGFVAGQGRLSSLPPAIAPAAPVALGNPDVVKAHKFVIVDSNGRTRATFGADATTHEQAALSFYDASGRPIDASGRPTARISGDGFSVGEVEVGPTGIGIGSAKGARSTFAAGFVLIGDPERRTNVAIWPTSILLDSSNDQTWFASDFLHIHKGQAAFALDIDPSGNPRLSLVDEQGRTRAQLGTADLEESGTGTKIHRSPASLVLFKEDGRVLWEAP